MKPQNFLPENILLSESESKQGKILVVNEYFHHRDCYGSKKFIANSLRLPEFIREVKKKNRTGNQYQRKAKPHDFIMKPLRIKLTRILQNCKFPTHCNHLLNYS